MARRARDLVDGGAAPESIVICAESEARRALLVEALSRYGLPVAERRRAPAASAPPVQLALSLLYQLADEQDAEHRLGRERLIALASSRYLAPGALPAHRLASVLREAGVVSVDAAAWEAPLAAWQARHPESRQREAERGARRLGELLRILRALPPSATWGEHAAALRRSLEELQLPARTRGFAGDGQGGPAETRALARDQAALRALELLLQDLPRAATRAGLQRRELARARFSRLLEDALAAEELRSPGVRGAAVEVTDLASLAERRPAHLILCGLVDGELPARPPEDPLLGDDERLRLNRVLGVPALPLDGGGGRSRAPWPSPARFVLRRQRHHHHLDAHRRGGRAAARARRCSTSWACAMRRSCQVARDPLPRVAEARTLDELTARVALEVRGDRGSRLSVPDRDASTELYRLLGARAPERLARLEHLAEIERRRERFFSGRCREFPSPWASCVSQALLGGVGASRCPASRSAPLSASAVESYAACPFKFFLRSVLDAAPVEEVDEELDPLARRDGCTTACSSASSAAWPTRGAFPCAAMPPSATLVAPPATRRSPSGGAKIPSATRRCSPSGSGACGGRSRRWSRASGKNPPSPGCTPARFEARFGPLPVRAPDSDERIYLHGLIDRIDLGPGKAVVLDYKSGAQAALLVAGQDRRAVRQLLAAAHLRCGGARRAGAGGVGRGASSTRCAIVETTKPSTAAIWWRSMTWDGSARARRVDPTWVTRSGRLHRTMRGGDFTVRPREDACQRCRMEAACRVMRAVDDPEVVE